MHISAKPAVKVSRFALWQTGFRPFFLGAALWSAVSMLLWFGVISLNWQFSFNGLSPVSWHAHEMVFGFSVAVIAGFLLTAVPNWTKSEPVSGNRLGLVFAPWLAARLVGLLGDANLLLVAGFADTLFTLSLFVLIANPIIRQRQFKQSGILTKVMLLTMANVLFYLGAANVLDNGMFYGLYTGFYLIIALILTMGRRVIPFFIERRLTLAQPLKNRKWVDLGSLLLFLVFWILEVFTQQTQWSAIVATILFVLHAVRLYDWHHSKIWTDPLLWVLYISYLFIVLGFALKGTELTGFIYSPLLALHMFAVGGVGLITCGMMARISLGHSGRNIRQAPPLITLAFISIALSAITRVFFPILFPAQYPLWISISQWLWILGFTVFIAIYLPILIRPRIDGQRG